LLKTNEAQTTPKIQDQVIAARAIQKSRQGALLNSSLSNKQLKQYAQPDAEALALLNTAAKQLDLSARSYMRCLKLARTIADLDTAEVITKAHVAEALQYRPKTINL
jgi:magnesium chelatase family protein